MSYKLKYITWKIKYLNLKNLLQSQSGGNRESNLAIQPNISGGGDNNSESDDSDSSKSNKDTQVTTSTENPNPEKKIEYKTDPGRGILGDMMYYWVANININKPSDSKDISSWNYKEPDIETIIPEIVPYTEFTQEIIQLLYNHSRTEYDEGFDIGYIVGYESGCNQNTIPEKKIPPGNIADLDFLNGFNDGFDLAFYKGTKYYYTTWIQINNNNIFYKKNLINYITFPVDDENLIDKTDPNYDPIQEKLFNDYYVYLKKKIIGKAHWII